MKHVLKLAAEHIDRLVAGERITIEDIDLYLEKKNHEATGAEIREFYTKGWDSDYYYESEDASVQIEDEFGQWIAQDSRVYNLRDRNAATSCRQTSDGSFTRINFSNDTEKFSSALQAVPSDTDSV